MKTMQELENQSFRLSEINWRRKNTWANSETSRNAKNNRDELERELDKYI